MGGRAYDEKADGEGGKRAAENGSSALKVAASDG